MFLAFTPVPRRFVLLDARLGYDHKTGEEGSTGLTLLNTHGDVDVDVQVVTDRLILL